MNESKLLGVSVRGWLAVIVVLSVCALSLYTKELSVLKDLALIAMSFYFGQKSKDNANA